jgi:arabinogalactan oligomer / maltooligosaccharide transport system substrate-binding protein
MKRLNSLGFSVFAVVALLLAACGGSSSGGKVTLTFWYTENTTEQPAILKIVNNFNTSHPNIHVNAQYVDFNSLHDKFATAAKSTSGAPDVLRTDIAWTSEFAKDGYLLQLDGKVGDTSDFLPAPLAYNKYNGHLWGLPEVTDFVAMYYNKALLQQAGIDAPPATMDDLRADAKKLTNAGNQQYGFANEGSSYFLLPFIFAYGGGMISDDAKTVYVNDSQSVSGFSQLLGMIQDGSVQPIDFKNGYNNADEGFKSGKVAIIFNGPWQAVDLMSGSAFSGSNASNFGVAAIPTGPAGDVPRSPTGGQNYSIYAGTAHPSESVTFLNYLDSAQSQTSVALANGTLPTRQSAYTDQVKANKVISAFQPLLSSAKSRPVNPVGGQLFTAFDSDIQNALSGKESAQDALNKVAQDWQPLLSGQ